jgi:hypothetical protein
MYPRVVISSLAKQREITTCRYKSLLQENVMLCYGFLNKGPAYSAKVFPTKAPLVPC